MFCSSILSLIFLLSTGVILTFIEMYHATGLRSIF